jgi:hypothetical protein
MILRIAAAAFLVAVNIAPSRGAVEVQDQSNIIIFQNTGTGSFWKAMPIDSSSSLAQVITAGHTGKLTRVELGLGKVQPPPFPLFVDIVRTTADVPDFSEAGRLASRQVLASAISDPPNPPPSFTLNVDFSAANLNFVAQDRFAIVLRTRAGPTFYMWWVNFNNEDTYPGGSAIKQARPAGQIVDQGTDFHFRTFVEIPEPSAFAIAASSLFALGFMRRHQIA